MTRPAPWSAAGLEFGVVPPDVRGGDRLLTDDPEHDDVQAPCNEHRAEPRRIETRDTFAFVASIQVDLAIATRGVEKARSSLVVSDSVAQQTGRRRSETDKCDAEATSD